MRHVARDITAIYALGARALQDGRPDQAVEHLRRALDVQPDSPVVLNALSVALDNIGDVAAAEAAARAALDRTPHYAEAWHNLGNALRRRGRRGEASAAYEEALRLRPDLDDTLHALASCLFEQGRPGRAADCYRRLVDRWPDNPVAHSDFLLALWHDPRQTPREVYEQSRRWAARHAEPLRRCWLPHENTPDPSRRLRVGYVSADFRDHAVGRLVRPVLAHHDRDAFEVFCYSDVEAPDGMTARLRALADAWRDTASLPDEELAGQVRSDRIDILVDCCGHFAGNRLLAFALRPAPVQVSHFGYCGTTGMAAIDYRITDAWSDPPGATDGLHTETLVRLEGGCCWCYAPDEPGPDVGPLPALSAGHVTFGSLNRPAKLNDLVVETWARVLHAVPRSRLMLLGPGTGDTDVSDRFAGHGIGADRIELTPRVPRPQYLALHQRIDVGLDPFPFNGDNTLCDALWMGVPSVALAGDAFVSRRGVSHLNNVGLPELMSDTVDRYVELAAVVARDLPRLADLRAGLRDRLRRCGLGDALSYTRDLEAAYRRMVARASAEGIGGGRPAGA
jgi:protein O-GlcNAc transferase